MAFAQMITLFDIFSLKKSGLNSQTQSVTIICLSPSTPHILENADQQFLCLYLKFIHPSPGYVASNVQIKKLAHRAWRSTFVHWVKLSLGRPCKINSSAKIVLAAKKSRFLFLSDEIIVERTSPDNSFVFDYGLTWKSYWDASRTSIFCRFWLDSKG